MEYEVEKGCKKSVLILQLDTISPARCRLRPGAALQRNCSKTLKQTGRQGDSSGIHWRRCFNVSSEYQGCHPDDSSIPVDFLFNNCEL